MIDIIGVFLTEISTLIVYKLVLLAELGIRTSIVVNYDARVF